MVNPARQLPASCVTQGKFLALSGLVGHDSDAQMMTASSILSRVSSIQVGVTTAKSAGRPLPGGCPVGQSPGGGRGLSPQG